MNSISKPVCILLNSILLLLVIEARSQTTTAEQYQCLPCGQDCDTKLYDKPGECSHCHMQLVKKSTVVFKNIQPSEICSYITNHPEAILLDVRTTEEFEGKSGPDYGSLKNAINIPIQQLSNRLGELNAYKNKEIIVYCSHSHRSPQASYLLTQNGFENVTNMSGGMSAVKDKTCKK